MSALALADDQATLFSAPTPAGPAHAPADPLDGPTLDDVISHAWEALGAQVAAACPVCGGRSSRTATPPAGAAAPAPAPSTNLAPVMGGPEDGLELARLEEEWMASLQARDMERLEELVASRFRFTAIHLNPEPMSRRQWMDAAREGYTIVSFAFAPTWKRRWTLWSSASSPSTASAARPAPACWCSARSTTSSPAGWPSAPNTSGWGRRTTPTPKSVPWSTRSTTPGS